MQTPYSKQVANTFKEGSGFGDAQTTAAEFSALRVLLERHDYDKTTALADIKKNGYPLPTEISPEMVALAGVAHACSVTLDLAETRGEDGKDSTYESYTTKNRFDRFTALHLPKSLRATWDEPIRRLSNANPRVSYPETASLDYVYGVGKPYRYLPAQMMRNLEFIRLGKLDDEAKALMGIDEAADQSKYAIKWDDLVPTIEKAEDVVQLAGSLGTEVARQLLENGVPPEKVAAFLKESFSTSGMKEEHGPIEEADQVYSSLLERLCADKATKDVGDLISGLESTKSQERSSETFVRDAQTEDIESLKPILEQWIRSRDTGEPLTNEVSSVLAAIESSIQGQNGRKYVVAEDGQGKVIGMMGMTTPGKDMQSFITSDNPVELINAYVYREQRGTGAGKLLAMQLEKMATLAGRTEIIVNSGPRYKDTGWAFWTRMYGEPVAVQKELYGPGGDAPVWRKPLLSAK